MRGNRTFYREMLIIALPVALQQLLSTGVSFLDMYMVSSLGNAAMGAVGLVGQFGTLYYVCFWGFVSTGSLFFAQFWGCGDRDSVASAYGFSLSFVALMALLFTSLSLLAPGFVMGIYTNDPQIRALGATYLRVLALSFPAQALCLAVSMLLRATGQPRVPMLGAVFAITVGTLLKWVLIFGKWGAPALGLRGAALGTAIGLYGNLIVMWALSAKVGGSILFAFKKQLRWPRALVREYLIKAAPIISNEVIYGFGLLLINSVMGRQGVAAVAAMSVFRSVENMVFAAFEGVSNAAGIVVGRQVGAGELREGHDSARRFAWICYWATLALGLMVLPLSPLLSRLFGLTAEGSSYLAWMLAIFALLGPMRTCNYIMNLIFRSGGAPLVGAALESGSLFLIALPLTFVAGIVLQLPYPLVFLAMYLEEVFKLGIEAWLLRKGRWIKPVTEEGKSQMPAFTAWLASR